MSQENNTGTKNTNSKKKKPKQERGNNQRFTPVQSQIETQLASLFTRARVAEGHFRDITELGVEGVDHINVNRHSKTTLGYLLSTSAKLNFQVLGKQYNSIGNLIAYYKSHCTNEEVAMSTSDNGQHFTSEDFDRFPPFKNLYAIVCLGYWDIIKNNQELFKALDMNDLPLDSYIERKNVRSRHMTTNILISVIKEAHNAVKADRDPKLNAFIFDSTLRTLHQRSVREKVYMETLIAEMFKPETVRVAYMVSHGNALAAADLAKEIKAKQEQQAQATAVEAAKKIEAQLEKKVDESVTEPVTQQTQTLNTVVTEKTTQQPEPETVTFVSPETQKSESENTVMTSEPVHSLSPESETEVPVVTTSTETVAVSEDQQA
jgi:hypothetical protein